MAEFPFRARTAPRRGMALIVVMVVLALMSVTTATFLFQTRMEINMVQSQLEATRAYYLARSGVWRAITLLRDDLLKDHDVLRDDNLIRIDDKEKGIQYDGYSEPWGSDTDLLENQILGPRVRLSWQERREGVEQDHFTVRVYDESGRMNINANQVPLRGLQRLLEFAGVEEHRAPMMAAAIIDWRDPDDEVTLPEEDFDARDYGDEASEVTFYNPDIDPRDFEVSDDWRPMKNAPFDTVEELLLVPGMDYQALYNRDPEAPPFLNEEDAGLDDYVALVDLVTVQSFARVNINTAPFEVLEAMLYDTLDEAAEDAAEKIVAHRNGRDRILGTDDDEPFRSWDGGEGAEGKAVADVLDDAALQAARAVFDVRSDTYRIVSKGHVGRTQRQISVVVSREFFEEERLLDVYGDLLERLGIESPEFSDLEARQREQVKFTFWEWNDFSFVDFDRTMR